MNIGLIGNGYWGKNLLRNLLIHQQIKKIFVLDFDLKSIKKSPNVQYFNDKKKFFSNKEIDIYIVATPTKSHFDYINECLKLDKFVCITKPFTSNYNQAVKLQKKFKNVDKIFLDHTYLFHSSIKYMKTLELIIGGVYGMVISILR